MSEDKANAELRERAREFWDKWLMTAEGKRTYAHESIFNARFIFAAAFASSIQAEGRQEHEKFLEMGRARDAMDVMRCNALKRAEAAEKQLAEARAQADELRSNYQQACEDRAEVDRLSEIQRSRIQQLEGQLEGNATNIQEALTAMYTHQERAETLKQALETILQWPNENHKQIALFAIERAAAIEQKIEEGK